MSDIEFNSDDGQVEEIVSGSFAGTDYFETWQGNSDHSHSENRSSNSTYYMSNSNIFPGFNSDSLDNLTAYNRLQHIIDNPPAYSTLVNLNEQSDTSPSAASLSSETRGSYAHTHDADKIKGSSRGVA